MSRYCSIVFVGLWVIFSAVAGKGQDAEVSMEPLLPKDERFVPADGLIFPERSLILTCGVTSVLKRPDCPPPDSRRIDQQHILEIQDSDGSLWYRFSVYRNDPAYFIDLETREFVKKDFKPLGPGIWYYADYTLPTTRLDKSRVAKFPTHVILRLVSESPNWYEVEVNDDTRLKKYVSKRDPLWVKIGWQDVFSINHGAHIVIDTTTTIVLDKPNGTPISPPCGKTEYQRLLFSSLEEDWIEVNKGHSQCHGWIRWRNGRDILVGSHLNGYEVVNPKNEER